MEKTGKKKLLTEKRAEIVFLTAIFAFCFAWAVVQPLNASPDEAMRYDIVKYLVKHGTIPDGRDPEIRNQLWGISYAFNPILAYMVMAIPCKIVSLFTESGMVILMVARMVNVVFGTIMAWLTLKIGKYLFKGEERWLFTFLVMLLPGCLFVHSYVNNDSMALFATTWIVYTWVRSIKEGWSWKLCVQLAVAISVCGLSYYNAYGYVLCSIFLFGSMVLFSGEKKKTDNVKEMLSKGSVISLIVLALIGWWFIRNGILYHGDILGWNISTEYAEKYALENLKPSHRVTPQNMGMSIKDMILWVPGEWQHNWLVTVVVSFIGTFGFLDIFMPYGLSKAYILVFGVGILCTAVCWKQVLYIRETRTEKNIVKNEEETKITVVTWKKKKWSPWGLFHIAMAVATVIPFGLLLRYAYANDFQAQGRYILPMLVPFMYFVTYGYRALLNRLKVSGKIRKIVCAGLSLFLWGGALYTYIAVFLPNYI